METLAYSSAWRQWNSWCIGRQIDPTTAPVNEILEFLCNQFESGKQYRTINSIRSAISMTHEEVDGSRVGSNTFFKGGLQLTTACPQIFHYVGCRCGIVIHIFIARQCEFRFETAVI